MRRQQKLEWLAVGVVLATVLSLLLTAAAVGGVVTSVVNRSWSSTDYGSHDTLRD